MNGPGENRAGVAAGPIDCDAIYRGQSQFRDYVGNLTPWDIGEPQPAVVGLEQAGLITGEVLDAGCGLGDNAIYLHQRGYRVTAFDASPIAIGCAEDRARQGDADIDFRVVDAMQLPDFGRLFDTIVDSALYHCLGEPERRSYISGLRRCCEPGGHLHILCFSDTRPQRSGAPRYVSEAELRQVLADGWTVDDLRLTGYVTSFTREDIAKNPAEYGGMLSDFHFDERDRFVAPAWLVTAERS